MHVLQFFVHMQLVPKRLGQALLARHVSSRPSVNILKLGPLPIHSVLEDVTRLFGEEKIYPSRVLRDVSDQRYWLLHFSNPFNAAQAATKVRSPFVGTHTQAPTKMGLSGSITSKQGRNICSLCSFYQRPWFERRDKTFTIQRVGNRYWGNKDFRKCLCWKVWLLFLF